jgi:fibronectin type 3 domain-containing protein
MSTRTSCFAASLSLLLATLLLGCSATTPESTGGGSSAPTAPTGLAATAGSAQVALTWTASSGATSYSVQRSTTSGGPYTSVRTQAAPTYTDTSVTNGTTYYYVVSAVNTAGTSANSNQASATPTAPGIVPAVPTNLQATAGNAQVSLSWTASSAATSYSVQRSTTSGGPYTSVGNPTSVAYTDTSVTNGTTYYYVVAAVNTVGTSANSNQASATPTAPVILPAEPTNLQATAGNAQVLLSWTASFAATSYSVQRSTTSGGPYTSLGKPTSATYIDTGLTNGTEYFYVVSAVNTAGVSQHSTEVSATPTVPSTSVQFTPLHLYYLSPTGSDSNSGTSASEPWATPDHPVECGDVIIAAAGNYTNQFNQNWGSVAHCPSASAGIDGKGGIYFATLLCAGPDLEACQVNSGANHFGFDIEQESNWAVEGFKATTDGADDSNQVTPAFDGACGGNKGPCNGVYHHFAFINDIAYNSADGFGPSGYDQQGIYGVDYLAVVGDIAQNSAQGNPNSWYCVAAIDIVAPANYDNQPGTHLYGYGNFSYNNQTNCPTDVENFMFDTWDANAYANQGVAQNNMGWLSGRFGFNVFDQDTYPTTATAFILNNTLYGSNQLDASAWASGDINIQNSSSSATAIWGGLTIADNLVQENQQWPGGNSSNGYVYAFNLGGSYSNVTVGGSGTQNYFNGLATSCRGNACAPASAPYGAISFGTAAELGNNDYTSPALNNPSDLIAHQSGVPNCTGFVNTTACMGYNANTQKLTNPSAIYDLQPSASGAGTAGYQLPSTTCVMSGPVYTYYPAWLKGIVYLQWNSSTATITENADLVTKPCGL